MANPTADPRPTPPAPLRLPHAPANRAFNVYLAWLDSNITAKQAHQQAVRAYQRADAAWLARNRLTPEQAARIAARRAARKANG